MRRNDRRTFDSGALIARAPRRWYGNQASGAAQVRGSTAIDATVMASAAQRGDRVFTSDPIDLQRLQHHFRAVADIIPV
jgi:hypothetical protein